MLQRMTVPATPAIEKFLLANPGWWDVASISSATGYAYSTVKNTCEYLVVQNKAVRDGAPYERAKLIKYHGLVDYFGGRRLAS
jgi:hypothetical protein